MSSNIDATKPVAGNASTANVRSNFSAAKTEINALQRMTVDAVTATGTVDAIVATFTNAPTLVEGLTVVVKSTGANTSTTPTLNVNALGAVTIVKGSGVALEAGDIAGSRHYCEFRYDATNTVWVLMNPQTASQVTILAAVYPVGSVYTNAGVDTNPATLLGFGTWTAFGSGKVMVGVDAADSSFNLLGETGGSKNVTGNSASHVLTTSEIPPHAHEIRTRSVYSTTGVASAGAPGIGSLEGNTSQNAGGGLGHDHAISLTDAALQPYITVHMWKRTA